jgi:hypothetical protein
MKKNTFQKELYKVSEEDLEEIYLHEEKAWRQNQLNHADMRYWKDIPGLASIIKEKMSDWQKDAMKVEERIRSRLEELYQVTADEFSIWFGEHFIKILLFPEYERCKSNIIRLRRNLLSLKMTGTGIVTNEERVEKARQYPIYEMAKYRLLLRECGKDRYLANCPFHEDKSPSFYLYPTNTFHCFGCQENGDVIKLTMHLHGISFREAIKLLEQ